MDFCGKFFDSIGDFVHRYWPRTSLSFVLTSHYFVELKDQILVVLPLTLFTIAFAYIVLGGPIHDMGVIFGGN